MPPTAATQRRGGLLSPVAAPPSRHRHAAGQGWIPGGPLHSSMRDLQGNGTYAIL